MRPEKPSRFNERLFFGLAGITLLRPLLQFADRPYAGWKQVLDWIVINTANAGPTVVVLVGIGLVARWFRRRADRRLADYEAQLVRVAAAGFE